MTNYSVLINTISSNWESNINLYKLTVKYILSVPLIHLAIWKRVSSKINVHHKYIQSAALIFLAIGKVVPSNIN